MRPQAGGSASPSAGLLGAVPVPVGENGQSHGKPKYPEVASNLIFLLFLSVEKVLPFVRNTSFLNMQIYLFVSLLFSHEPGATVLGLYLEGGSLSV